MSKGKQRKAEEWQLDRDPWGTSRKIGYGCAARFPKALPYL